MGLKKRLGGVYHRRRKARKPAFVELIAPNAATPRECVIEFESLRGGKVRIQWKAAAPPDWMSLLDQRGLSATEGSFQIHGPSSLASAISFAAACSRHTRVGPGSPLGFSAVARHASPSGEIAPNPLPALSRPFGWAGFPIEFRRCVSRATVPRWREHDRRDKGKTSSSQFVVFRQHPGIAASTRRQRGVSFSATTMTRCRKFASPLRSGSLP
jgi:hypothetical protein